MTDNPLLRQFVCTYRDPVYIGKRVSMIDSGLGSGRVLQPSSGWSRRRMRGQMWLLNRIIHKSIRNLRTRLRNHDRNSRKVHINRSDPTYAIGNLSNFFSCVLGAVAYLPVSPLARSRDETWCRQAIRKRFVSWNLPKLSQL